MYGVQTIPDKKVGYDGSGYMVTWLLASCENASQILFFRTLLRRQ